VIAFLGATIEVPGWVAVIGAVLGTVAFLAAAIAVARQAAIRESLATIIEANAELRRANDDLHRELATERERRAALEGRLEFITGQFAEQLVNAVVAATKSPNRKVTT
jgi:hypothetical protein